MLFKTKENRSWYLSFTVCFLIALSAVLVYFFIYGKSLVWDCDGVYQHFNAFVYYGKYLRSVFAGLWKNHTLSLPMWDMSIGYGADILTTLSYYGIGDPLALTSALVPPQYAEYLYAALAVLRLYLSGIFFLFYCRFHNNEKRASVLGALTYCFSGFALFAFARHPAFINPMLYFPLLLIGIDRIFQKKTPWLFIWMTAISAISNFYFFYMSCVLMFVYAVIRYIRLFRRIRARELARWFFTFVGYFAVGVGIASVTLLPCAMYVLRTERMSADNAVALHYSLSHYLSLFGDFFRVSYVTEQSKTYTILGMVPLVLIAVFVLLIKRRQYRQLKAGLLALTVFFLTPFFGHVLNGFSYVSNRWVWGYLMLLSYILVKMYPQMFRLSGKEKAAVFALSVLYAGITWFTPEHGGGHVPLVLAMLLILCAAIAADHISPVRKMLPVFFYCMTFAGIALNAWDLYAPGRTNYIEEFRSKGAPYRMLTTNSEMYPVKELQDTSGFYRYDQYGVVAHENTAMQNRLYGTDFYFSVSNGNISRFFEDLYLYAVCDRMYDNLDGRSILERLASVRYFALKETKGAGCVPYAFDQKVGGNGKFTVYKSEETLPFGYTYGSVITQEQFEALPVEKRQQALLQGALVEQESSLPETEPDFTDVRPAVQIVPGENVTVDGNRFTVSRKGASVELRFSGVADSETYLVAKNMYYEGKKKSTSLHISMGDVSKKYNFYTAKHNFYSGQDDFLYNMGFSEQPATAVTVSFSAAGEYSFDEFYIVCQPVQKLNAQTALLREETLAKTEFSDNKITGNIRLSKPKMLVLSMAYSDGWSARVDGEIQPIRRVNRMYPGLELTAGEHEIELTYRTPYLREGQILFALSLIVFGILVLRTRKQRRQ